MNKIEEIKEEVVEEQPQTKVRHVAMAEFSSKPTTNPWLALIDRPMEDKHDEFLTFVDECRFFYKYDPIVSTVLNKLVEISINDLVFSKNGLSDNEFRVFLALKPKLLEFAENMALEYLLSGLVVPEYSMGSVSKDDLIYYGIKMYQTLKLPVSMFVRNPKTIKIETNFMSDIPSYYVKIPESMIYFIKNSGKYQSGDEDKETFKLLREYYPDFIKEVNSGANKILIKNTTNIIRRKYTSDNPYPIPYGVAALDSLKHKRQYRKMDYSIAEKVVGAVLHVKAGSDQFPITNSEEDESFIQSLKTQLNWRFNSKKDLERIFQFFTSHIVELKWVFPDTDALLNDSKYRDINNEIIYALGFPRILITGEAERSSTSDAEVAVLGPVRTMESMRRRILEVVRNICRDVSTQNNFKNYPSVTFKELNLHKFTEFVGALTKLYETGGLSRESFAEYLGYDFSDQLSKREAEQKMIEKAGIPQIGLTPYTGVKVQDIKSKELLEDSDETPKPKRRSKTTQVPNSEEN